MLRHKSSIIFDPPPWCGTMYPFVRMLAYPSLKAYHRSLRIERREDRCGCVVSKMTSSDGRDEWGEFGQDPQRTQGAPLQ